MRQAGQRRGIVCPIGLHDSQARSADQRESKTVVSFGLIKTGPMRITVKVYTMGPPNPGDRKVRAALARRLPDRTVSHLKEGAASLSASRRYLFDSTAPTSNFGVATESLILDAKKERVPHISPRQLEKAAKQSLSMYYCKRRSVRNANPPATDPNNSPKTCSRRLLP